MRKLISLLLLIAGTASAVDLNVRHFYVTNDVSSARPAVSPLRWYAGESVEMDLHVTRGSDPVDLSGAGMYPRWEVFKDGDTTNAYIESTGTIVTATNGYITFDLTPELANLPADEYVSYVKLYQPVSGTNRYVGMVYKTDAQVYWSPSATNFTYQGPYTNAVAPITSLIAGDNITLSPASGLGDVTISATVSESGTNTLPEVLAAGNTSGASDIILSASGLDQSRRIGFIVNDGIAPHTTNYLDSILDGSIRYAGSTMASQSWVTAQGYGVGDFLADGSVAMAGDLNAGGQSLTGASNITASGTVEGGDFNVGGYLRIPDSSEIHYGTSTNFILRYNNSLGEYQFAGWDGVGTPQLIFTVSTNGLNMNMEDNDITNAGNITANGSLTVGTNASGVSIEAAGTVSGADPTTGSNFVTKTYADANYSGGGGSSATNVLVYQLFNPSVEFADSCDPSTATNTLISRTIKLGGFDKDSDQFSDAMELHVGSAWTSNVVIRSEWWNAGTTNLTTTPLLKVYDAQWNQYIYTGTQQTVAYESAETNRSFYQETYTLSDIDSADGRCFIRFGWAATNAVNGDTRTGTTYGELFSCEAIY